MAASSEGAPHAEKMDVAMLVRYSALSIGKLIMLSKR